MKKTKLFNFILFIISLLIFYIPIFIIIIASFNSGKSSVWEGFSLKWYQVLFSDSKRLLTAFNNSLFIGSTSAIISTLIGTLGAWSVWNSSHRKFKQIMMSLSYMPLVLPDLIIGISLLSLFVVMALPLGVGSIFIAHTTMNIPFSFLLILSILHSTSDLPSLLEASKDLGASEWQTWNKVLIPILYPGILASLMLTFTMSLDDFAITFFVTGPGSTTLPIFVHSALRFGLSPAINALSTLIIGSSIILFSLNKKYMHIAFK